MCFVQFIRGRRFLSHMEVRKCKHRMSIIVHFLFYKSGTTHDLWSPSILAKALQIKIIRTVHTFRAGMWILTCSQTHAHVHMTKSKMSNLDGKLYSFTQSCIKFHENSISISQVVICTRVVPVTLKGGMQGRKCAQKFCPTVKQICLG